jgi:hypothetical protein
VSVPPDTVADPPPVHGVVPSSTGSEPPSKSKLSAGASVTSPSVVEVTTVFAPVVPCAKSAATWSCAHGTAAVANVAGAAGGSGDVASLLAASAERTRKWYVVPALRPVSGTLWLVTSAELPAVSVSAPADVP